MFSIGENLKQRTKVPALDPKFKLCTCDLVLEESDLKKRWKLRSDM